MVGFQGRCGVSRVVFLALIFSYTTWAHICSLIFAWIRRNVPASSLCMVYCAWRALTKDDFIGTKFSVSGAACGALAFCRVRSFENTKIGTSGRLSLPFLPACYCVLFPAGSVFCFLLFGYSGATYVYDRTMGMNPRRMEDMEVLVEADPAMGCSSP